jgi:hypothetical protein
MERNESDTMRHVIREAAECTPGDGLVLVGDRGDEERS